MNNCQKCIRSPHLQNAPLNFGVDIREGLPKTATTPEIIEQVHNIVSEDPNLTKREIANAIDISNERVIHILHGELQMKKCRTR